MKTNLFRSRSSIISLSLLLITVALFSACKKDNNGSENTPVAGLMAFNLAPDKSGIGIELSGNQLVNSPLDYTNFTGGYLNIFPGDRGIESYDALKDSTLANSNFNFEINKYYSLFLIGNNGTYKNVVVNDNIDSLSSTSQQAFIRYINAIPDSTAPTVTITANGTNILSKPASFGTVSDFVPVSAGDIKIDLANGEAISTNRTISIENAKAYTILLVGVPAATDSTKAVQIKFIKNAG